MAKTRILLCSPDAPYIARYLRLIETQSKATLGNWGLTCAETRFLPILEKSFADTRGTLAHTPRHTLGVILHGAAATAYDRAGLGAAAETYARPAEAECADLEARLTRVIYFEIFGGSR
ncbi:MAG: hypothetical protein LBT36_02360 [Oscillospiraceae bacterium]|nr:hypothetical protein [Oscillospiraceae bacterium]